MELFYIVFFTESDVAGGYIAEHYYIKAAANELPTLSHIMGCENLGEMYERLRIVVHGLDKPRVIVNATENPPSLSSLLLNAVYGGHRLQEIAYIITNRLGHQTESGFYKLGALSIGGNKPL